MSRQKNWTLKSSRFEKLQHVFSLRNPEFVLSDLLCQETSDLGILDKMYWLEQLLQWFFKGDVKRTETRFQYFFQVLDKNSEWKKNAQETILSILVECDFYTLFTQVGIAVEYGLWGDIGKRMVDKLIPIGGSDEFREIIVRVFTTKESVDHLSSVPDSVFLSFAHFLGVDSKPEYWTKIQKEIDGALLSLSAHVAHHGLGLGIRMRLLSPQGIASISFLNLAKSFQLNQRQDEKIAWVNACEKDIEFVYERMEVTGVSVDVVNRIETVSALLRRIRTLILLDANGPLEEHVPRVHSFLNEVVRGNVRGRLVLEPIRRHFYLLARKIAERNGHSGEHYIARSSQELAKLFKSSIGGGCVVVVMAIFKNTLVQLHPAPLFLALGIWIIYSTGFLSMQLLGFTLATKIPSFTASRLASLLKSGSERSELKKEFRSTLFSQALGLLGNILGVIPLALLIAYVFKQMGLGILSKEYALHTIHDLHPFLSMAIPLGVLTGILLWLSSIMGGWFENWVVFRQIPETIKNDHRFRKIFGDSSTQKIADWVSNQSSGIATNVSLGFLFGFTPLLGSLFGLNWNSYHVTISTAGATLSAIALDFNLPQGEWIWTLTGLLFIGAMNFGISFGLALFIASSSQRIHFRRVLRELF